AGVRRCLRMRAAGVGADFGRIGTLSAWLLACGFALCLPENDTRLKRTKTTGGTDLQWYESIFELIDMRSFSNLWYWIGLSVLWSSASHWIIGVPYDMVRRAARHGGEAEADLRELVRINVGRVLFIARMSGLWIMGSVFFVLAVLFTLAVFYGIEFAQAVLCLLVPMLVVAGLSLRTAFAIEAAGLQSPDLIARIFRLRIVIQVIGMVSIFFTAVFGMYQNMQIGVFG
ncbi:MAG: hypothetical protein RIR62_283, partial [Pseudomonadota bacterium]